MKFSIAATLLILAIGGALGLMNQKRLTTLREVAAKAEPAGISIGSVNPAGEPRMTKRQRDERTDQARALAAEMVAFARELEVHELGGNPGDEAFQKRGLEIQARLMELDASQLKMVIGGLRDDPDLSDDTRENLICYSIALLGDDYPAAALALFAESADLLKDSLTGASVVSSTLATWAKQDPAAALEWVKNHAAIHPEVANEDAKQSVVAGAAENDPRLALKIISEMQVEDSASAIQLLVESGKSADQRSAILSALRDYLTTLPESEREDVLQESLETMGRSLTNESFEATQSWIARAALSREESAQFAAGLSYFNTGGDTDRWIGWIAKNLPEDEMADSVDNLVSQWTQQDYQAAGKWLAAAPEGPAKQAAVGAYAQTVAEYEPLTAVQWALTLPAGPEREETLEGIYHNWPETDKEAATAFAKEHGIDLGEEDDEDSDEATAEP